MSVELVPAKSRPRKLPVALENAEWRPCRTKSRAVAALAALAQQQRAMAVDANRVGSVRRFIAAC